MTASTLPPSDSLPEDASLDSPATEYVRANPRVSYVQPDDPWWQRQLIGGLEVMMGRRRVEAIYHRLKAKPFEAETFFAGCLDEAGITARFDAAKLARVPDEGPLVFLANHPYGVVDGIILCYLALKARGDFRIMLHALLCQDEDLAPYFLPIDFLETREAARNNIRSKRAALAALSSRVPVLIFPSGMVSTADRFGFGEVVDYPWTTFAAKLIRDAKATVVPVYFHGQNSRKFHIASHIAEPLRMGLLINEALNKFERTIDVDIGDPVPFSTLESIEGRQALTDHLYHLVQNTKSKP